MTTNDEQLAAIERVRAELSLHKKQCVRDNDCEIFGAAAFTSSDLRTVLDLAEEALRVRDWHCPYCGSTEFYTTEFKCDGCCSWPDEPCPKPLTEEHDHD